MPTRAMNFGLYFVYCVCTGAHWNI